MAVHIQGDSMHPTLCEGDVVIVDVGAYTEVPPTPGDLVLAEHPFKRGVVMVKRVDHLTTDGRVYIVGDNRAESTDSRTFGALHIAAILGRVSRAIKS